MDRTLIGTFDDQPSSYFPGYVVTWRTNGGFGYDPLFLPDEFPGKTMAQLTAEEKDSISHRGKALRLLAKKLEEII